MMKHHAERRYDGLTWKDEGLLLTGSLIETTSQACHVNANNRESSLDRNLKEAFKKVNGQKFLDALIQAETDLRPGWHRRWRKNWIMACIPNERYQGPNPRVWVFARAALATVIDGGQTFEHKAQRRCVYIDIIEQNCVDSGLLGEYLIVRHCIPTTWFLDFFVKRLMQ